MSKTVARESTVSVQQPSPWIKLPVSLIPLPDQPFNAQRVEAFIVGSFLLQWQRLNGGASPNLRELAVMSGRTRSRTRAAIRYMREQGWIGAAKVRHRYGVLDTQIGLKWRFWLITGSPLAKLEKERFVPVPYAVARSRSVIGVGIWLLAHEQRRLDGAVTTNITEIANLLHCDRATVRRQLEAIGARRVATVAGSSIWDVTSPLEGHNSSWNKVVTTERFGQVLVPDCEKAREALFARARQLEAALSKRGESFGFIRPTFAEIPRLDMMICLVERAYERQLFRDVTMAPRLGQRLGARLRRYRRRRAAKASGVEKPVETKPDSAWLLSAATTHCHDCDGTRWILGRDDTGHVVGRRCETCVPD